MLKRVASVGSASVRVAVLTAALTAAYAGYEFYEGGKERVREKFAPVAARAERAQEYASVKWEKTGEYLGRTAEKVEDSPENLLYVLLTLLVPVLLYRLRGHNTKDALVAAFTKVPPAPVQVPVGELTAVARAENRRELKARKEDLADLLARQKQLPAEIAVAKKALDKAADETVGAAEMLALCEQVEDEANAKHAQLSLEFERGADAVAEMQAEIARLEKLV